jgi:hypothetical protein
MITHSHQTRTSEQQRKIKKRSQCLPRTCHQHITSERQQQQQQKIKRRVDGFLVLAISIFCNSEKIISNVRQPNNCRTPLSGSSSGSKSKTHISVSSFWTVYTPWFASVTTCHSFSRPIWPFQKLGSSPF